MAGNRQYFQIEIPVPAYPVALCKERDGADEGRCPRRIVGPCERCCRLLHAAIQGLRAQRAPAARLLQDQRGHACRIRRCGARAEEVRQAVAVGVLTEEGRVDTIGRE